MRVRRRPVWGGWLAVAAGFAALALGERFAVHERVRDRFLKPAGIRLLPGMKAEDWLTMHRPAASVFCEGGIGASMFKWLRMRRKTETSAGSEEARTKAAVSPAEGDPAESDLLVELAGRTVRRAVRPVAGVTVLDLAEMNGVDWQSRCKRGTCARCRCLVREGREFLTEPNRAEIDRLGEAEIARGYRLGCQARIAKEGRISIRHASYFP